MRTLILNTSDTKGGAARAAYRLHQGLQRINGASQMLVQTKRSDDSAVLGTGAASGIGQAKTGLRLTLDQLPLKRYPGYNGSTFSPQWLPDRVAAQVARLNPDVINLHWINAGFLQIETIARLKKPLVWTLHDMWAFTGGCHYTQSCDRYEKMCGACPQLGSSRTQDLSRRIWQRKAKTLQGLDLTIVTPSQWLKACAESSTLLKDKRIDCIPNGLDPALYRPFDKQAARAALRLPADQQLILFGSLKATSDRRKGFHLLQTALQQLSQSLRHRVELVVFGASEPEQPPEFGFKTHYLGSFSDDLSLMLIYSAADAFILPSVQENLANTVMEALACAVPCVAFEIGGMPDMIEHQSNGYLAKPYEADDLANGIAWVLEDSGRHQALSERARAKVISEFTLENQASRYHSLFEAIRQ
ncbi:MAG: glycosyltransferase [Leptolyngbya sp. SIO4C1]|nr:glycosyltransferase [Leptolyngbya sp. SIO4C1]